MDTQDFQELLKFHQKFYETVALLEETHKHLEGRFATHPETLYQKIDDFLRELNSFLINR